MAHLHLRMLLQQREHGAHVNQALLRLAVHGAQEVERHRQLRSAHRASFGGTSLGPRFSTSVPYACAQQADGRACTRSRCRMPMAAAYLEKQAVDHDQITDCELAAGNAVSRQQHGRAECRAEDDVLPQI